MGRRVVITGLGFTGPKSTNIDNLWKNLCAGNFAIESISKCSTDGLVAKVGGQVVDCGAESHFNKRMLKKCDDFSIYSLLSVEEALNDSHFDLSSIEKDQMGIYVGNNSGGWHSAQDGLIALHSNGTEAISPYLASNWFPAAPQGHISIHFGITGYSKTVVADMASSTIAIGNAYRCIKNGQADYMLAGGTENLIVSWGLMFYQTSRILSGQTIPQSAYLPFDRNRSGLVLAEGAAFVLLETLESAKKRNAHIYAEIVGFGLTNDGFSYHSGNPDGKQYARAIKLAAYGQPLPNYISLNGTAVQSEDDSEVNGLKEAFGADVSKIPSSTPKAFYGHSYGAAGAMDTVTTCLIMKNQLLIKSGNSSNTLYPELDLVCGVHRETKIDNAMVINKGLGGINAALYLKRFAE